jgi:hypothetical protein
MARGWESKSVESQIESAAEEGSGEHSQSTPEQRERNRQRETLRLARARVAQQLAAATDPRYIESLRRALADLDAKLEN